jgi:hypothetical protein
MNERKQFSRDEMRIINQRATELMHHHWEHARNLMLDAVMAIKHGKTGMLTDEDLKRVNLLVDINVNLKD